MKSRTRSRATGYGVFDACDRGGHRKTPLTPRRKRTHGTPHWLLRSFAHRGPRSLSYIRPTPPAPLRRDSGHVFSGEQSAHRQTRVECNHPSDTSPASDCSPFSQTHGHRGAQGQTQEARVPGCLFRSALVFTSSCQESRTLCPSVFRNRMPPAPNDTAAMVCTD